MTKFRHLAMLAAAASMIASTAPAPAAAERAKPFPRLFEFARGPVPTCVLTVSLSWPKASQALAERNALAVVARAYELGTFEYAPSKIADGAALTFHLSNVRYANPMTAQAVANAACGEAIVQTLNEKLRRLIKLTKRLKGTPVLSIRPEGELSPLASQPGEIAVTALHGMMQDSYTLSACSYRVAFKESLLKAGDLPDDRDSIRFLTAGSEYIARHVLPILATTERNGSAYVLFYDECERARWFVGRIAASARLTVRNVERVSDGNDELERLFGRLGRERRN